MKYDLNKYNSIFIAGAYGMVGNAILNLLNKKFKKSNVSPTIFAPTKIELNYLDSNSVNNWFKLNKPEIVIISAAKVGGIIANSRHPSSFLLENLKIQNNLIEASYKYQAKRLLFLGSSCIYPKFSKQPIKEEYLLSGSLEKTNESYAIAKIAGIKLCAALNNEFGFDALCLMPTNLYGPGDNYSLQSSHVLPALIRKFDEAKENNNDKVICFGSGDPLREFLYVDDLAEACLYTLENWAPSKNNFPLDQNGRILYWLNVGSDQEISIKSLAEKIAEFINYKGKILWDKTKPDGTPRKKLDCSKIKSLGWYSKTNLDDGIQKTIENYQMLKSKGKLRIK
tara:strand:+ start:2637 stop:3653 length:1017 start_codon:yes stop_codon:yes gene_type:complete